MQWEKSATKSSHNVSLIFDDVFSQLLHEVSPEHESRIRGNPFQWEPVVHKNTLYLVLNPMKYYNRKSKFRN